MFTGIVEEIGTLSGKRIGKDGVFLTIKGEKVLNDLQIDNSIAVNGVCQTVTEIKDREFTVFAMEETLKKTTLGKLKQGAKVNLERALTLQSRLGGHIVQGHVDCVSKVTNIERKPTTSLISIRMGSGFEHLAVLHGSITVDGVSLTIARKSGAVVTVSVIPYTLKATTLSLLKKGDEVNIETDIIGKYLFEFANKENLLTKILRR
jgi:riboflavin synthase